MTPQEMADKLIADYRSGRRSEAALVESLAIARNAVYAGETKHPMSREEIDAVIALVCAALWPGQELVGWELRPQAQTE